MSVQLKKPVYGRPNFGAQLKVPVLPKIAIETYINFDFLKKAVFLNNNILQFLNLSYNEVILFQDKDEVVYFQPSDMIELSKSPISYHKACLLVHRIVFDYGKLDKQDMLFLNDVYKLLKEGSNGS